MTSILLGSSPLSRGIPPPHTPPAGSRGSSPLSRGIRDGASHADHANGIIPALAGNTLCRRPRPPRSGDHPRSRGEYWVQSVGMSSCRGSSPLSRGILDPHPAGGLRVGIIPALAGNTRKFPGGSSRSGDHPRSRGEYAAVLKYLASAVGSSPLSRGIPRLFWNITQQVRIIPALAGNTHTPCRGGRGCPDHPRSRGEYHGACGLHRSCLGSSPLSRGIPGSGGYALITHRIIPALAGNTFHSRGSSRQHTDHPRSRGEYQGACQLNRQSHGSSPLSRGIPLHQCPRVPYQRIIPALAGNTQ